jgi:hypothetical protein
MRGDDGEHYLDALDADGITIAYASQPLHDSRWTIVVLDGETPDAWVGDEHEARAWLDFIAHLHLKGGKGL